MLNLKSKFSNSGFTLIELMVVVAIMVLLVSSLVINLAGQRAPRDLKIAQSQLVSNIRLAQSYTLSSRLLPSGQNAQFYLLKFDLQNPTQYTIQAVYNASVSPQLTDVQTIQLPANIRLAAISPIAIDRFPATDAYDPSYPPTDANRYLQKPGANGCALIAFAMPFAKVIFNGGCTQTNWDQNSDDYAKIVNFQANTPCVTVGSPTPCTASTDSIMTITLTDSANSLSKTVTVNAITGGISFN
jgi:prepilin-type N-terminal cleavage/methylation domain-containing protein